MGGAAVAFGEDGAMPWVNPAGVVRAGRDNLTLSANAWATESWSAPNMVAIGGPLAEGSAASTSSTDSFFPSSVSFSLFLDDEFHHVLALSMLVPNRQLRDLTARVAADTETTVGKLTHFQKREFTQYEFGPSYSFMAGMFSFGLSTFLRYLPLDFSQFVDSTGYTTTASFMLTPQSWKVSASSLDLDIAAGVQAGPFLGGFYAGASLHSPSIHLSGSFQQEYSKQVSYSGLDQFTVERGSADVPAFVLRTPLWFSVGAGYQVSGKYAFAVDVSVYLPQSRYANVSDVQVVQVFERGQPFRTEGRDLVLESEQALTVNVSAGAEVHVLERLALRAGFFTDLAANAEVGDNGLQEDVGNSHVDRFGGSLGLGYAGTTAQFQLSLMYLFGTGDMMAMNGALADTGILDTSFSPLEVTTHTFMVAFSGRVDLGVIFANIRSAFNEEVGRLKTGSN
jgi:hypothetical protein